MPDLRTYAAPFLLIVCLASTVSAGVAGACAVHKTTEIKCLLPKEGRGIIVDIRPERPHVQAKISTYWTNCNFNRIADPVGTFIFSQDSTGSWYRYNGGFHPVEGSRNPGADCIEVYITDCMALTTPGHGTAGACSQLLTANGFKIPARAD